MQFSSLYKKVEQHVTELFRSKHTAHLALHNLEHTQDVVKRTNEIAAHYRLSEEETAVLFVSAWFHDTGYLTGSAADHEIRSAAIMEDYVSQLDVPEGFAANARACIMATKIPRNPRTLPEEILCDADTYQFGNKKEFKDTNKRAYRELRHFAGGLSKREFDEGTLSMLGDHKFYTSYCRELLSDAKQSNMKKIKKNLEREEETESVSEITERKGTQKGMQTMLRLTSSNHIQLSEMADSKANILISVNAIIISVILSVLLRKLQTDPYLTIPTIIFLTFSVITIVVAILATRPKLNTGTFDDVDVVNKKTNLLFFGNFHKMSQERYETAMRTMMRDSDYLYGSMIQDIFHLGTVLGKKYRLIRLAYNVFMIGIIASVLAFSFFALFNSGNTDTALPNSSGSPF